MCCVCCSSEFPPRQRWWLDMARRLDSTFQVLRSGQLLASPGKQLLEGDILYLRVGQKAPADCRVLIHTEGATLDCSHLTARANDVRICSKKPTTLAASESRNTVLKGSYIIQGALFCMVVQPPWSTLLAAAAPDTADRGRTGDSAQDASDQFVVETAIPAGLS